MTIDVTIEWLKNLKVSESNEELEKLLEIATAELELRIGKRIAEKLSEDQIEQFENLPDYDRLEWLEQTLPDYELYVNEQYEALNKEIMDSEDRLALIRSWK